MKSSPVRKMIRLSLLLVLSFPAFGIAGGLSVATSLPGDGRTVRPAGRVVRVADGSSSSHRVPPPLTTRWRVQEDTFSVEWNPQACPEGARPWPADAKAAFLYAAGIWDGLLESAVPIRVVACWLPETAFGVAGWIGAATAVTVHQGFPNAPMGSTYYPAALANALAEYDINDADGVDFDYDGADADAEVDGWFNADRDDWYFGTDGNPAPDELDFVSLVLHELAHGLGFVGSANVDGVGQGSIGPPPRFPDVFDRFTEDGGGTALLGYANPSQLLGDALTGQAGGIYFDSPTARGANGGPVRLYAPAPWDDSSYSHLDEQTFNDTANSLMTPVQSNGESEHHPGPVTLAMFQDMGWGAVNTPPRLSSLPDQVVAVNGTKEPALDLWAYASDDQSPDHELTFSFVGSPDPNAGVTLVGNRYVNLTPAHGWAGTEQVTVRATDPGELSDTETFRVTVTELSRSHLPLVVRRSASTDVPLSADETHLAAGTSIYLTTQWYADTASYVQDYLDALELAVVVDGEALSQVRDGWGGIAAVGDIDHDGDVDYVSRWRYAVGVLSPGAHLVDSDFNLPYAVTDGFDWDGDGELDTFVGSWGHVLHIYVGG